ncbi:hypothetical protein B0I37DRAFT_370509 [Chaetomium sp. MPI-CAGE-AT-0009]|nr:hypothetical protein B0I37DRAFT_370509 [Chaetomium sp. MPI-CAGE-AT-0009]
MAVRSMFGGSWVVIFFVPSSFPSLVVYSWGLTFGGLEFVSAFGKVKVAIGAAAERIMSSSVPSGTAAVRERYHNR